jgi:hypothetical protein
MASGPVGKVVLTCPACGAAFEVSVRIASIRCDEGRLMIVFDSRSVEHTCKGRH